MSLEQASPAVTERTWFHNHMGGEWGPLPESAMLNLFDEGFIGQHTSVRPDQQSEWTFAQDIEPFASLFSLQNRWRCPDCGVTNEPRPRACRNCSYSLSARYADSMTSTDRTERRNCGTINNTDARRCSYFGLRTNLDRRESSGDWVSDSSGDWVTKLGRVLKWILVIIAGVLMGVYEAGMEARQNARIADFFDALFGR